MIRSNYSTAPLAVIMGGNINLLIVFGQLVAGGIGVTTDDPDFAKWLRNTNVANLVVWSYWWPVIIIVAIVLGRLPFKKNSENTEIFSAVSHCKTCSYISPVKNPTHNRLRKSRIP